jgi:uncharacterized protein YyaL (SSP411 family)
VRGAIVLATLLLACQRSEPPAVPVSDPLPGSEARPAELVARLREAAARESSRDQPRTRHRRADGSARYTNRLLLERSPYLRQHAHNPVDWYPWGDEAFARARREGRLVLLSVGYATCHWCHVMEEESFEDEEIAAAMNTDYVAIKVDREERPDIDGTYLQAVALLTGGGGWPMTVWLTPDREVFFAGTYFPPRDGDRGARMGFLSLLRHFADAYRTNPAGIAAEGRTLTARVHAASDVEPAEGMPGRAVLDAAFARYAAAFDHDHGGFGRAPKFPMPAALEFLLRYYRRTKEPTALAMVQRTLAGLAAGGVHDQLGGGFHRYATDAAWQIPHFEKMLYDNAQLASVYLMALQATGDATWGDVARAILDDVLRTLRAPEGAFWAAVDADDPGGEGTYYTWTPDEISAVLTPDQRSAVETYYGVDAAGNLGGRTVLHVARAWSEDAGAAALLTDARARLLQARAARPAPLVDTKILAGWNGLAISALARAGAVLDEPRYVQAAVEAARFVLDHMRANGRLLRVHADGSAGQVAFLEDHAFLAAGFLDLYEATFDLRWLTEARRLHETLDRDFSDPERGAYFESGDVRDPGLPRAKPADDGALPSGNAVAAENLVRLATFTDDETARARAAACVLALGRGVTAAPTSAPRLLGVVEALLDRPREIVLVEPAAGAASTAALMRVVQTTYLPNRALVVTREGGDLAAAAQALAIVGEKHAIDGRTTAYVCERGRCLAPTSDPETLARQLSAVLPLPPADEKGD